MKIFLWICYLFWRNCVHRAAAFEVELNDKTPPAYVANKKSPTVHTKCTDTPFKSFKLTFMFFLDKNCLTYVFLFLLPKIFGNIAQNVANFQIIPLKIPWDCPFIANISEVRRVADRNAGITLINSNTKLSQQLQLQFGILSTSWWK